MTRQTVLALCGAVLLVAEPLFSAEPPAPLPAKPASAELVYVDEQGVIRWCADHQEIALFGANYSLASACDYRAAGYIGADRKKLVAQDMAHFARMGWDGMRLSFWGDWENSDKEGNLVVNDHLDVLDYVIYQAKKRGIYILFTPITTYSSLWPEGKDSNEITGFSKFYKRADLGTNPEAIKAQCNYLRQILSHVNPYTGTALKDETQILFLETINEPVSHSDDEKGSVAYINALAEAVRATGCRKLLFYNLSQDFGMAAAIKKSQAEGVTFAWYPTGLNSGHELAGNYLRTVDDYAPMRRKDLMGLPKLVYEFDSADMNSGFMYPAMVRTFRSVGAQFIAMFSYDMLATAPYNLGWQTHFLSLVYSPRKAVSAIIAAEAARALPLYQKYGGYPSNQTFPPFRVSYEEDLSELASADKFFYSNTTKANPPVPRTLKRVIGCGNSSVARYEGSGLYFLDKVQEGLWRLEVYPDAETVLDPFAQHLNYHQAATRLLWRRWPMAVHLPDLGTDFNVTALNEGNSYQAHARAGGMSIEPGVYLLSKADIPVPAVLPDHVGRMGLREFVCPPRPAEAPPQVVAERREEFACNEPVIIAASVIADRAPEAVTLHLRPGNETYRDFPMAPKTGYRYEAVPSLAQAAATLNYFITVKSEGRTTRFPADEAQDWSCKLVAPDSPLTLFDASRDLNQLVFTRIGDGMRRGIFQKIHAAGEEPASLRLFLPLSYDRSLEDYTASLAIKKRVLDRKKALPLAKALRVKARGSSAGQQIHLTLVEADGTSWSQALSLTADWQELSIRIADLKPAPGVMLPLGFPGRWNYWLTPPENSHPPLQSLEHVQISMRPEQGAANPNGGDLWADFASIVLVLE